MTLQMYFHTVFSASRLCPKLVPRQEFFTRLVSIIIWLYLCTGISPLRIREILELPLAVHLNIAHHFKMQKILCVDDQSDVRLILQAALKSYELTFATSMQQASELLSRTRYALVLLDVALPDGTGLEILATASDLLADVPVIFLSSKRDLATKASAFALGAEDFIDKPFDPKELKIRVDAKLRKQERSGKASGALRIGPVVCNLLEQRLFTDGGDKPIDLTTLEFKIFYMLAQTPNRIFSRAEILDRAWGTSASVTGRAVDVHISNLRKKLTGSGVNLEAVIGSGYRVAVA